ncbi:YciI family protein [Amycolatopsis circi]|uniref:YciI family protein n=1 Tax=Amycolatopsis circi TaxID=871959 RepID=UPI000E26AA0B|nr:YciI family protein [Amycolatopsis circi]
MKRCLLAVQGDETTQETGDELVAQMARTTKVTDDMKAAGAWVFVGGLPPSYATTVVRPANGTTTMTDGPFAETKEQLGGFWVKRQVHPCGRPVHNGGCG